MSIFTIKSLLTASALEPIAGANPEAYLTYAIVLALFVGIFQLFLGLLKLGVLILRNILRQKISLGILN